MAALPGQFVARTRQFPGRDCGSRSVIDGVPDGAAEWILHRSEWDRVDGDEGSEEFGPANHQVDYLRERIWRTHRQVDAFLAALSAPDLEATRQHPADPTRTLNVRYDVVHALEHLAEHVGHAQLTRQLWTLASG